MYIVLGTYLAFMAFMALAYHNIKTTDVDPRGGEFARGCALQECKDIVKIGTGLAAFVASLVYFL